MFTWGLIVLSSPKLVHVDWKWPISGGKYLKIDWPVKMPLHWLIGDLTYLRRWWRGRRLVKNVFLFYFRISHLLRSIQCVCRYFKNLPLLSILRGMRSVPNTNTKNQPLRVTFFKQRGIWSFNLAVLRRTATKCTKNDNARPPLLLYFSNLLLVTFPLPSP